MTKKDLIIIAGVAVIASVVNWIVFTTFNKPDSIDYGPYKREFLEQQDRIDSNSKVILNVTREFIKLQNSINEKDSIIDGANSIELDSLFDEFFREAGSPRLR